VSRKEPSWRRYLTFWRPTVDRDVDAEIHFHFDERVADLRARGRSEADARAEAEAEFGDRDLYRQRIREIDHRVQARRDRAEWLGVVRGDIRLAWRGMRRSPALSMLVVTTLALGIGANGAIFSLLDRIFFRPPAGVVAPGELRRLYADVRQDPPMPVYVRPVFGTEEFQNIRKSVEGTYPIAGYRSSLVRLGTAEDSPMGQVADVLGNYFRLLGVRAEHGRLFAEDELTANPAPTVAVISDRYWRKHFGGDAAVLGQQVEISRQRFTIVGIAQQGFDGLDLDAVDIWRPANLSGAGFGRGSGSIRVLMRVGTPQDELRAMKLASDGYHAGETMGGPSTLRATSVLQGRGPNLFDSKNEDMAKRLAGVTLIVLLIALANVANLLLTRAIQRRREIAIRVSLGVSRGRLAAQLITESAVLALIAGAAALVVGTWGASLMRRLLLPTVRWSDSPFDLRLGLYTLLVALTAGLLVGLLPFFRAGRFDLAASMRGGGHEGNSHRSRTRATLIVAQTALSVVLLAGAVMFVRSLRAVEGVDIGFDPAGVIMTQIYSGQQVIPDAQLAAALIATGERMRGTPGVVAVATSNLAPMGGLNFSELHFPGRDSLPQTASGPPTFIAVSPDFFKAVGVSVVAGRPFLESDRDGAPRVMVVTRTMARVTWGSANPLGQCVKVGKVTEPCTTVVGVIEDVRRDAILEKEALLFYLPLSQAPKFARWTGVLIVRANPDVIPAVEREIRASMVATLPGSRPQLQTFAEKLDPQYRPWRVGASLFTVFGLLALLVAAIGVYSAISYAVMQRSHELGVRMALGAQRAQIGRSVVGSGLRVVGFGVLVGVGAALALGRLVESLLYGVSARDPVVFAGVAVTLLVVATIAAALPAWRATRLDPVRALRAE
jgi:predicted permease